jgi:hypothetical protein
MSEIKIKISEESRKQVQEMNDFLGKMKGYIDDLQGATVNVSSFKEAGKAAQQNQQKVSELENAYKKLEQAGSNTGKQLVQVRAKTAQLNAETRKSTTEYGKLEIELKKAQDKAKELGATLGVNSKEFKKAAADANELRGRVEGIKTSLGNFTGNVGNYTSALGKLTLGLKSLMSAFGVVAGIQMFVSLIRESAQVVKEFDQAQADLASILGKTKSEIKDVSSGFKELGSTTAFSAKQATDAAIELAKLGFTISEIKNATPAVLNAATALGVDLADAATLVGNNLRAFGLDASEAERVASVLGVSTTKSALDFNKLATALGNAAPAANAYFESLGQGEQALEQTTALLGLIVDKGIDASTAGTSLRNIFIELAKSGKPLEEALNEIANSQDKLTTANELFGTRNAVTAIALADSIDKYGELTEAITDQDEAMKALVSERLNTLQGSLTMLKSAWEGMILSFEDGDGVIAKLAMYTIQGLTILVQKIGEYFARLNERVQKLSAGFQVFYQSIKPAIDAFRQMTKNISEGTQQASIFTQILDFMRMPIIYVVEGLLRMAGVLNGLIAVFSKVGENFKSAFEPIVEFIQNFDFSKPFESMKNLNLTKLKNSFSKAGSDIGGAFSQGYSAVVNAEVTKTANDVADEITKLSVVTGELSEKTDQLTEKQTEEVKTLIQQVKEWTTYKKTLEENINALEEYLKIASPENQQAIREELAFYNAELLKTNQSLSDMGVVFTEYVKAQDLITKAVKDSEKAYAELEAAIEAQFRNGELSAEEYYRAIGDARDNFLNDTIDNTVSLLQDILNREDISADERLKIEEDLAKAKKAVRDRELADIKAKIQAEIDAEKEREELIKMIRDQGFQLATNLANEFATRNQERLALELSQFKENNAAKLESDIALATEQGATQEELEAIKARGAAELAAKENEIRRQQAQAEKRKAIFDSLINTSRAAVQALPNIPLSIAIGIQGAIQTALIASRPIPQFAKGVRNFEGGMAVVGEAGREIVNTPNGSFLADRPMLTYLPTGTDVYNNRDTERMLSDKSLPLLKQIAKKNMTANVNVIVKDNSYVNWAFRR